MLQDMINGTYACEDPETLNGVLKTELGFQGFVVSDWYADHAGLPANAAGMDMVMPLSSFLNVSSFAQAARQNSSVQDRLNDQVLRILASWYRFAKFDAPGVANYLALDVRTPAADDINLQSAIEGHVLVKNVNNALPLRSPHALSIYGYDAIGGDNTSATGGSLWSLGLSNSQTYTDGAPFTSSNYTALILSSEPNASGPSVALNGTLMSGAGSGAVTPESSIPPYDALRDQATRDGTLLATDFVSLGPKVIYPNDPCLVLINAQFGEGWDKTELADDYSDTLVKNVAAQCSSTVVVIHNAGIRLVDAWYAHPNISAIIYAHTPGEFSGTALVELLYGRQSPSGRLPYTVAKDSADYGNLLNPVRSDAKYPQDDFTEGLEIDYKHFIANDITPRFPFGFGLSYTTFSYSGLSVSMTWGANTDRWPPGTRGYSKAAPEGGWTSLYDVLATVKCTVDNTGAVAGAEVAQLYIGIPGSRLPKVLRGFDKHLLAPGESGTFTFPLRRRDLSSWDVAEQQWVLQPGSYQIMVGRNVLEIELSGSLNL